MKQVRIDTLRPRLKLWAVLLGMGLGLIGLAFTSLHLHRQSQMQARRAEELSIALEALAIASRKRVSLADLRIDRPGFRVKLRRVQPRAAPPYYILMAEISNAERRRLAQKYSARSLQWFLSVEVDRQGLLENLLWSPP